MSDLKQEVIKPDPAPTSTSNDEAPNTSVEGEHSAPTDADIVVKETKEETSENGAANGDSNVKDANPEVKGAKPERKHHENRRGGGNGRGRGGRENNFKRENKSKYDYRELSPSEDPSKIRAQMEFYFGDANLPQDKTLWELTDGAENKPVSLKWIHSKFNRMKRFQPYNIVVDALRKSEFLSITGEEGDEMVSRKDPYNPRQPYADKIARTVYVKGFGEEKSSSQFDIEAWFATYGPTDLVRLRRAADNLFKGSVFCQFSKLEDAEKFLALDPKPKWQGEDFEEISTKLAYTTKKEAMIKAGEMEPNETRRRGGGRDYKPRGGHRSRDQGDRDPDDWKKRRDNDQRNGFKDGRRDGRGGRGRGRGGRGNRDDRGPRNDERSEKRGARDGSNDKDVSEAKPKVEGKDEASEEQVGLKRSRDDDDGTDGAPAKKVKEATES